MEIIRQRKTEGFRPYGLDAVSTREGMRFCALLVSIQDREWEPYYGLSAEELLSTIQSVQAKGWRPDVLTPYWDKEELRFLLVAVDNRNGPDWRFCMDMTASQVRTESAEQRQRGLFPLALVSYGNDDDARHAAIWVRHRKADSAAPAPAVDPRVGADRSALAITWTGAKASGSFADLAHGLKDVADFRDLVGVDAKELRDWHDALGANFRVSFAAARRGAGPTLSNAVAVREAKPLMSSFLPELAPENYDENWNRHFGGGFRPVVFIVNLKSNTQPVESQTRLWIKDGQPGSWVFGLWDFLLARIAEAKINGYRPVYLDTWPSPDGLVYGTAFAPDQGRAWESILALSAQELPAAVEFYARKGWRPDLITPYWDGDRLQFMLVAVDNSDQIDWRFRMDMIKGEYQKESAQQRQQGLFPLALVSYGNDADIHYAAVFMRFRGPAKH